MVFSRVKNCFRKNDSVINKTRSISKRIVTDNNKINIVIVVTLNLHIGQLHLGKKLGICYRSL